jgi:hypothetical protein
MVETAVQDVQARLVRRARFRKVLPVLLERSPPERRPEGFRFLAAMLRFAPDFRAPVAAREIFARAKRTPKAMSKEV